MRKPTTLKNAFHEVYIGLVCFGDKRSFEVYQEIFKTIHMCVKRYNSYNTIMKKLKLTQYNRHHLSYHTLRFWVEKLVNLMIRKANEKVMARYEHYEQLSDTPAKVA